MKSIAQLFANATASINYYTAQAGTYVQVAQNNANRIGLIIFPDLGVNSNIAWNSGQGGVAGSLSIYGGAAEFNLHNSGNLCTLAVFVAPNAAVGHYTVIEIIAPPACGCDG